MCSLVEYVRRVLLKGGGVERSCLVQVVYLHGEHTQRQKEVNPIWICSRVSAAGIPYIICILIFVNLLTLLWPWENAATLHEVRQTKIPFFRWRLKLVQHDSLFTFSFYVNIVLTQWLVLSENTRPANFVFIETDTSHSHFYIFDRIKYWPYPYFVQSPTKAEQLIRTYSTGDSNHSSEEGSGTGKNNYFLKERK